MPFDSATEFIRKTVLDDGAAEPRVPRAIAIFDATIDRRTQCSSCQAFAYNPKEASKRPTIADIARLCGVIAATVSRVLNNTENFSTSETVRKKIRDTAQDLGHRPDLGARNLSLRNSRVIGPFASPHTHIAEGINESLIEGITETLHGGAGGSATITHHVDRLSGRTLE
jgi:hypothetical protein